MCIRIYLCLPFPVGTESKYNIGKQGRYWLCLHGQARETRASWIPCLVYPHLGAARDNRSSIHCQIFTYITGTCSYCTFYTNRQLQKNFPLFFFFSFSERKTALLMETQKSQMYYKTREFVFASKFWRLRKYNVFKILLYHYT